MEATVPGWEALKGCLCLVIVCANKKGAIPDLNGGINSLNFLGGAERDRTVDLMTASHALSQLSYSPGNLKSSLYHF